MVNESVKEAFVEAFAPELREALHGRPIDVDRFNEAFRYQLRARNVLEEDA